MKKILAIVLAVVMLLPVFAVNVFAEDAYFTLTATCENVELGESGAKLSGWCPALLVPWKNGADCTAFKAALAKEDAVIEVITDKAITGITFQASPIDEKGGYPLVTLKDKLSEKEADGKVTATFSAKAYLDLVANSKYGGEEIPDEPMSFDHWNTTGIDTPWDNDKINADGNKGDFADVVLYSFKVCASTGSEPAEATEGVATTTVTESGIMNHTVLLKDVLDLEVAKKYDYLKITMPGMNMSPAYNDVDGNWCEHASAMGSLTFDLSKIKLDDAAKIIIEPSTAGEYAVNWNLYTADQLTDPEPLPARIYKTTIELTAENIVNASECTFNDDGSVTISGSQLGVKLPESYKVGDTIRYCIEGTSDASFRTWAAKGLYNRGLHITVFSDGQYQKFSSIIEGVVADADGTNITDVDTIVLKGADYQTPLTNFTLTKCVLIKYEGENVHEEPPVEPSGIDLTPSIADVLNDNTTVAIPAEICVENGAVVTLKVKGTSESDVVRFYLSSPGDSSRVTDVGIAEVKDGKFEGEFQLTIDSTGAIQGNIDPSLVFIKAAQGAALKNTSFEVCTISSKAPAHTSNPDAQLLIRAYAQEQGLDWSWIAGNKSEDEDSLKIKVGETLEFSAKNAGEFWKDQYDGTVPIALRLQFTDLTMDAAGDKTTIGYTLSDITVKATGYDDYVVPGKTVEAKRLEAVEQSWGLSNNSEEVDLYLDKAPCGSDPVEQAKYLAAITDITFTISYDFYEEYVPPVPTKNDKHAAFVYITDEYHAVLIGGKFIPMPHQEILGYCPMCHAFIETEDAEPDPTADYGTPSEGPAGVYFKTSSGDNTLKVGDTLTVTFDGTVASEFCLKASYDADGTTNYCNLAIFGGAYKDWAFDGSEATKWFEAYGVNDGDIARLGMTAEFTEVEGGASTIVFTVTEASVKKFAVYGDVGNVGDSYGWGEFTIVE